MEDLVLSIPTQDAAFIETLAKRMGWTMRKHRTQNVRRVTATTKRRDAAMLFVQNLSVRGGQPVPADERGVSSVTLKRRRKTSMDRAMEDIEQGRVYKYDSLDDLIKEIEG